MWDFALLITKNRPEDKQVFSCEVCKMFKNTYFEKHLRTTASVLRQGSWTKFYEITFFCEQVSETKPNTVCLKHIYYCICSNKANKDFTPLLQILRSLSSYRLYCQLYYRQVIDYIVTYGSSFTTSRLTFKYTLARHSSHHMSFLFLIPR